MNRPEIYDKVQRELVIRGTYWFEYMHRHGHIGKECNGVYVAAYDITYPQQPILISMALVGAIDERKQRELYMHYVMEKCCRLGEFPEHVSSAQSRDVANKKYAGAVCEQRCPHEPVIAVGTSGAEQFQDETLSTKILQSLGLCSEHQGRAIMHTSNNAVLRQLLNQIYP